MERDEEGSKKVKNKNKKCNPETQNTIVWSIWL